MKLKLAVFLIGVQLSACGGGGSGGSPGPADLEYSSAPVMVVGTAIAPLTPTVSGTVTEYTISPALPAGLSLSATTGTISGTPTAPAAMTSHTVTASNEAGSTTASVSIQVDAPAPMVVYPSTTITLTRGAAALVAPTSTGGAVVSWSITPALPAGLTFDTATGTIAGTATSTNVASPYVVTATNSGGKTQVTLTIQVVSTVVLDLGHATPITHLLASGARLLSEDLPEGAAYPGRCILWNTTTDAMVTSTQCDGGQIALAGPTAVIPGANGLLVLSSSTGLAQATITGTYSWWQLAADGSYIAAGSASGLNAWSPTGQSVYSAAGDYSHANAFAATGEILVALGPAGSNVIQTVSLSAGTSSTGPKFQGTFNEWFTDGSHFQTATGTTVWTYSSTSVQEDLTSLSTLAGIGGEGNWFWTSNGSIYAVGSSATPALTASVSGSLLPSGTTLAILSADSPQLIVVNLSGASPVQNSYTLPSPDSVDADSWGGYAATSASNWYAGNNYGALLDGRTLASTPKYLALGAPFSIAGGGSVAAVATGSGQIVVVNPQTSAVQTIINFPSAKIQMSSDGTVLAAMAPMYGSQFRPDESITVFSLPSGSVLNTFPYSYTSAQQPLDFTLAPTGTLLAQVTGTLFPDQVGPLGPPYARQVTAVTGGPVLWSDSQIAATFSSVLFSPDATLMAVAEGLQAPGTGTNIYQNFTLTTAVSGWPVGWIDNSRLLTNTYVDSEASVVYSGATIYSASGAVLATPALPELQNLETVNADSIYSPDRNSIYSLTTGQLIFGSGNVVGLPNVAGALVGSYVVYPVGPLVVAVAD